MGFEAVINAVAVFGQQRIVEFGPWHMLGWFASRERVTSAILGTVKTHTIRGKNIIRNQAVATSWEY